MSAAMVIVREWLCYAVERQGKGAMGNVYHACWPTEFPLTRCGVIATEARARPDNRRGQGRDCEACIQLIKGKPNQRDNPHREGA